MNKKDETFWRISERATLAKLASLGNTMRELETKRQYALKASDDDSAIYYLQLKGEISLLAREVNEVIRNHEVKCPHCSYESNLGDFRLIYAGSVDKDAIVQCRRYDFRDPNRDKCSISLTSDKWGDTQKILSCALAPLESIFSCR